MEVLGPKCNERSGTLRFEWRCCTPRLPAAAVAFHPPAPIGLFLASMPFRDLGYPAHESVMTSRQVFTKPTASRGCPLSDQTKHSVENPLLDLDGSADRKLVYGCDGDLVAEFAKGSRQHLGTFLLFSGTHFVALLDESHSFMQDLPNYTTEPMGNGPDGGLIA